MYEGNFIKLRGRAVTPTFPVALPIGPQQLDVGLSLKAAERVQHNEETHKLRTTYLSLPPRI